MTVLAEVSTPPQIRRVDKFQEFLDFPLSKNRDDRRLEHTSSKHILPPIKDGMVVDLPSSSPRKSKSGPVKSSRPSTALLFEGAKTFHANKGHHQEMREKLMESHMTFMNWKIPPPSRSASSMSGRPGTSLQKLQVAKQVAKKSPYTKENIPSVQPEKMLKPIIESTAPIAKRPTELPEKEKAQLKDWLTSASAADKIVITDLIECADRLTLTTVTGRKFRPGLNSVIKLWLKSANEAERSIAEKFLGELDLIDLAKSCDANLNASGFAPLMDRSREIGYRDGKTDQDLEVLFDNLSKELNVPLGKSFTRSPRYATHFGPDRTPAALWHLDKNRDVKYSVLNSTASFVSPNRDRGTHFDIHPDWPNYYS